jgi:hypothetical protein
VRDVVREVGAEVEIGMTGRNHQVAVLRFGGKTRKVFFACSPSDRNAFKQAARHTRRVLQTMGAAMTANR